MRRTLALALIFAPLAACSTVQEAVRGPDLTPVGYPAALVPQSQEVMPLASAREPSPQPASANSLWRTGARAFFIDQRAGRVGDILTVQIDIDDSAKTSNNSTSSRTASSQAGVNNFLGLESSLGKFLPGGFDPANAVNTGSSSSNSGAGSVTRSEKISLTIAAVVTAVLPNGNMVIQGTQEVRTNAELRQLTVAGIVRPEDISSANTIKHTQIAEARISYGGRGDISRVQKVPAGQSLVERFSPF
ncbi:MAG: flagellar basal body L-ring protein FlgH [Phenylobacterium sp.]|uniref:flagellar basal body L-ring protein FlgH n=1 Tax=Phenylobacterium sp. TaxID=1871053 RepID=UPI00391DFFCC